MESLVIDPTFWKEKKVFVTGHTGFKGAWLCLWLNKLGAKVTGYALSPPTNPALFEELRLDKQLDSRIDDIRDLSKLKKLLTETQPEIVFHLAAQPLVRTSYSDPILTYETNVMGTANLLEAVRYTSSIRTVINVTTDKVYENKEWCWPYREFDSLGGFDPYSNSKACSEMVTHSFRDSFFPLSKIADHRVAIASARAGNVLGGGDWAQDRLIPDLLRALEKKQTLKMRYPHSIRPWQHVLEPLSGYLTLAHNLTQNPLKFSGAWNFGPNSGDERSVEWIVRYLMNQLQGSYEIDSNPHPHEANFLRLDCSKSKQELHWEPCWNLEQALSQVTLWFQSWKQNRSDTLSTSLAQIELYEKTMSKNFQKVIPSK